MNALLIHIKGWQKVGGFKRGTCFSASVKKFMKRKKGENITQEERPFRAGGLSVG